MKKYFLMAAAVIAILSFKIAQAAPPQGFSEQTVVSGIKNPSDYAFAPDGRIIISTISGTVVVYKNGQLLSPPALNLTSASASITVGGDRGLMSVALDPNFSSNGFIYLLYTTGANHQRISRFTFSGDSINPGSEKVLLENSEIWGGFLNAGAVRYNPIDGKLYASFGSNGEGAVAQDLSSLDGKLVRINLDGSIPKDNPFVSLPGAQPAIWSSGFRNPWRINVDTQTGAVMIGDVGENTWEKVVRSAKGANFGWPTFEGDCSTTGNCGGITPPIFVYNHNGGGSAITGGDVYKGSAFPPQYSHAYFYGDFVKGYISVLTLDSSGNVTGSQTFDPSAAGGFDLATISSGPDGCLYFAKYTTGEIHRYCYTASSSGGSGNLSASLGVSTDATNYTPGSTAKITSTATANQNASGLLLDTEIWGASGKVSQNIIAPLSVVANTPVSSTWQVALPQTAGNYTLKTGLFAQDWSKVYSWNDAAASFNVGGQGGALAFTDKVILDNSSYAGGVQINASAAVTASQNLSGALVDLEIFDASNKKISQQFTPADFTAGQQKTFSLAMAAPASVGTYTMNLGVFKNDWSQVYFWDAKAASFSVASGGGGSGGGGGNASFVVSASMLAASFAAGANTTVTTKAASTQTLSGAVIDTEIHDSSGKIVAQKIVTANLTANQQFSSDWSLNLPQTAGGPYTVKVGIFSSDWSTLYFWQNRAFQFYIGSAPGSPQPGQTYTVNLLQPQNNQTVSGSTEIRAVINGLDINSYTISWRTGGGSFFSLDTDPVTQAYKHAWIDFTNWNWMPNNIYPLEFQATDNSGRVIGDTNIQVTVKY